MKSVIIDDNIKIRQENIRDFVEIEALIIKAFEKEEYSDHKEQELVKKIRASENYVPSLSLIAEIDGKIVGYIMLSEIVIKNDKENLMALALAPVCVLPGFQKQGVGAKLIKAAEERVDSKYCAIILLGHPGYYTRFGYRPSVELNIKNAFDLPSEYFMAKLVKNKNLQETEHWVLYPDYFLI